jgi:hypothetical protein
MSFTPSAATTRLLGATPTGNPTLPISATWNNAATTFTGIQFDVTDTASAAGSLLMDLRVGGVSRLSVDKGGNFNAVGTGFFQSTLTAGTGFVAGSGSFSVTNTFNAVLWLGAAFGWASSTTVNTGTTPDLSLYRDAADTLAQRRGVNAQAFRIYNTFTDASNYERVSFGWSTNIFTIGRESAGTGTARNIRIVGGNAVLGIGEAPSAGVSWTFSANNILAGTDNAYDIGAAAASRPRNLFLGSYMQLSEMTAPAAPAANNVVIYAEDNGSGKTRLMARFATGAAQQIAIEP